MFRTCFALACLYASTSGIAQVTPRYDIGNPVMTDIWVNPGSGNDGSDGASAATALRTLGEAWRRVPQGVVLDHGYRIQILPGTLAEDALPNYMESRYGTKDAPIIIQSASGSRSARLGGDLNVFDTRYLYIIGLDITPDPPGDAFHCEQCDHLLIRDSHLDGGARQAHDMLKVNQSHHVYIEDSDLSGADDNTIDFVAVQYGHVLGNRISNAQDWCMYAKGGSAYLQVAENEIFDCGTGGFTAGQGTGLQFMVAPWIHYEAYDIKVTNNIIHDTEGAGLGVNGGYNILMAYNTVVRSGFRDHMLEVGFGARSCDGVPGDEGRETCQASISAGGRGTTVVDDGTNYVRIPSRNVFVYDNIFFNPPGTPTAAQIFAIAGPFDGPSQEGGNPRPALADTNLQIRGNLIYDAPGSASLGVGEEVSCASTNPTCNESQLLADNTINTLLPVLAATYRPGPGGEATFLATLAIPPFSWADAPAMPLAPAGNFSNVVPFDRDGLLRGSTTPGAYGSRTATATPPRRRAVVVP